MNEVTLKVSIVSIDSIRSYEEALNSHLELVFEDSICFEINDDFLCAVVIEDDGRVIACGFAYSREMSQGAHSFNAGIIGGIAVKKEYRGQGLCKKVMEEIDACMVSNNILISFLFAYEPMVYLSSGYSKLLAPIHYFDKQLQIWNTFVYRGGMVKSTTKVKLLESQVIEFKGCVY